ncbi:NAD(P)H-dependent flavin oxidoreductase [Thermodesulfobacteriota bacterium]
MFQTEITRMLGIKYPIIGGTMMWITNADFAAAISNAGGLGIISSPMYQTPEEFAAAIDRAQELTDKPFGVNINLFPTMRPVDNKDYVEIMVEKGVKIVETSGHSAPEDLCARFKEAGMTWMHKCVGIRYALKVRDMGADIVTVVGYENGGATGKLDLGTLVLVPSIVDAINLPVVGGGGVSDGRGFLSVLALGAQGVIIGTRLMTTEECPIHEKLKNALLNATELDTTLVMRSLNATHRVWTNDAAQRCQDQEACNAPLEDILSIVSGDNAKRMYEEGDLDAGIVSCGQGVGLCHDIPTVKQLFDRIIGQAKEVVNGFDVN